MASNETRVPEAPEVERRILDFLHREVLGTDVALARDAELLTSEVVDSIGILRLAAFVGEEFGIEIQPSEYVIENFQSVAALAAFVRAAAVRSGRTPEAPGR